MLGFEGKKVALKGADAEKVMAAIARSVSGKQTKQETKAEKSFKEVRKRYSVEWTGLKFSL